MKSKVLKFDPSRNLAEIQRNKLSFASYYSEIYRVEIMRSVSIIESNGRGTFSRYLQGRVSSNFKERVTKKVHYDPLILRYSLSIIILYVLTTFTTIVNILLKEGGNNLFKKTVILD